MEGKKKNINVIIDIVLILLVMIYIALMLNKTNKDEKYIARLESRIDILTEENKKLKNEVNEYQEKYEEMLSETCIMEQELIEPLKIYDAKEYYLLYKEIIDEYSEEFGKPLSIYDVYTEEDIKYIQKCVETECYDCPFENKVNVANVIINRVNSERFPNTPIGVVTSPKQFAYHRTNITEDTVLAVEYAFMFEDTTDGALFFHSGKYSDTFSGAKYIFEDSVGHKFYK